MSSETKKQATTGAFSVGSSTLLDCPFCGQMPITGSSRKDKSIIKVGCNNYICPIFNRVFTLKEWNIRTNVREFKLEEALKLYAPNHELLDR